MTAQNLPSPRESLLLGSLADFNGDHRLEFLTRVSRECGEIASFRVGPIRVVLLSSPAFFQAVLVDHADDFDKGALQRNGFGSLMGNGILTSEGPFHHAQRKLMAPAFTPKNLTSYADAMVSETLRLMERWSEGQTLELDEQMMRLSMNIGARTLFGTDVFNEASDMGAAIAIGFDYINYRLSSPLALPLSFPSPRNLRFKQARATIHQGIQAIIDERRANLGEQRDLLTNLLRARDEGNQGMTDAQLRDEALTLFAAGYETAAKALVWSLYLLATHPEHFARLRQEVDSVLGDRAPTASDLPRLPYSLQVYKEALRLYPPGAAIARQALRDVDLQGHTIPKGQLVMLNVHAVHHRPDFFPDPERFEPERFTPENEKKLPRYAFMPFAAGPRVCIGNFFALMQGQLVLSTLAQRLDLTLLPGQTVEPELKLTLRPRQGVRFTVQRRQPPSPSEGRPSP